MVKTCLKTLSRIGADGVIQNVTFLGGAADISKKENVDWPSIFSNVVSGRVSNVYSEKDLTLILYNFSQQKSAIGRRKVFEDDENNIENKNASDKDIAVKDCNRYIFRNFDISDLIIFKEDFWTLGHMIYRKKMLDIFAHIQYDL